jgi:hypothetical protein
MTSDVVVPTAKGGWPMCSTPEPIIASCTPATTSAAEKFTSLLGEATLTVDRRAWPLDRQPRLQPCVAGDVEALLAELLPQPAITSLTCEASIPERSMTSV